MKPHHILSAATLGFAATLAVVVGLRLSAEAMAVLVGVIAGVAASIPASLVVVWLALRGQPSARLEAPRRDSQPDEPRIIVIHAPPEYPALSHLSTPTAYAASFLDRRSGAARAPRHFTVIGADDTL